MSIIKKYLGNLNNLLFVLLATLAFGCGQKEDKSPGISINSKYINLSNQITDPAFPISLNLYNDSTKDFNTRANEDILFRPPFRPTVLKYAELEEGVLGLTECEYSSDGKSECSIKLSPVINPDTATSEPQREARKKAYIGVIRHELGHAFGLGHIKDNENHVMYPYFKIIQLEEENVVKFMEDLENFRINGAKSGLPPISTK